MKIEESNKLIAEFMGYEVKPNVANWTEFDEVSLTTHWNNNKGTWVHTPKGSGRKWYKVFHREQYYQLFTDFTFSKLDDSEINEGFTKNDSYYILKDSLLYYSYDWLMPVVEKIESFIDGKNCCIYNFKQEQSFVEIVNNHTSETIVELDADTKLEAAYKAVVEFIKWYNDQEGSI